MGIHFDHVGHSAGEVAKAVRDHVARIAAGPAPVAQADSGRTPHRALRRPDVAQEPAIAHAGDPAERQSAQPVRRFRHGPDILFLAQRFAQEEVPSDRPAVSAALATARYPSLGFREELILPGQASFMAREQLQIDIYA